VKAKRTKRLKEQRATYRARQKRDGLGFLTVREKQALAEYLARLRAEFGDEIERVILYGSKVRGDFDNESDIDLFVVFKELDQAREDALSWLVLDLDLKYAVLLSDFPVNRERFERMAKIQEPLYRDLMNEGVELWMRTPKSLLASALKKRRTTPRGRVSSSPAARIAKPSAVRTMRSLR
jgi:predicted nucleotidyltransferase